MEIAGVRGASSGVSAKVARVAHAGTKPIADRQPPSITMAPERTESHGAMRAHNSQFEK